jgi:hypothetical protein
MEFTGYGGETSRWFARLALRTDLFADQAFYFIGWNTVEWSIPFVKTPTSAALQGIAQGMQRFDGRNGPWRAPRQPVCRRA